MKAVKVKLLIIFGFLLITFTGILPAFTQEAYIYSNDETININVYEKVSPSVVTVLADAKEGASSGTGVIIDPSGLILSSSHVVGNAQQVFIITASGEKLAGIVKVATDKTDDLALIKVNPIEPLKSAVLGDSSQIRVGQKVLAIGNPFGFERTLTIGIISRIDYERERIQTDAAINPGSSGGPLLNTKGQVIGINQSLYNPDNAKANVGISFSVPINAAKKLISQNYNKGINAGIPPQVDLFNNNFRLTNEQQRHQ